MIWAVLAICAIAALYQLVAIAACVWHFARNRPAAENLPPVSILKPVYRPGPELAAAVRSHLEQDYPEFEVLAGVSDNSVSVPGARTVLCSTRAPNGKAGILIDLARAARYNVLIVNDADIQVPPHYLRDVVAELVQNGVGLVTCIYRAEARTFAGRWEALGIATDFAPSTLVAPFVGVSEFGLGATLAVRRADLDRIGGFAAVADYLADDYQLGAQLHAAGARNVIARPVVSTSLGAPSWSEVWRHQVRWARTIRFSRTAGYAGLPVTFATLWAILAALCGLWWIALSLLAIRFAMAFASGWLVLRSRDALRLCVLVPLRDLYSVAIWAAALFGNTVEWGGHRLALDRDGRIVGRK